MGEIHNTTGAQHIQTKTKVEKRETSIVRYAKICAYSITRNCGLMQAVNNNSGGRTYVMTK
jgi:hypothetical protein